MEQRIKVGFPRLGSFHVFLEPTFRLLGGELIAAPPSTRRTLDLGVRHNAEMICTPCKLLFGNYVEALERGAEALIMLGGPGTCRLGYSARTQEALLRQMGYHFTAYTANPLNLAGDTVRLLRAIADPSWYQLIAALRFLFDLIDLVDAVEKATLRIRPLERDPGTVDRLRRETLSRIADLPDRTILTEQRDDLLCPFESIPCHEHQPLRIALVGDLYTMLEPFFNMDLERELGRLGVHVQRSFWLSDDARDSLRSTVLRRGRGTQKRKAGAPYLARDIGGFARRTVGDAALLAQSGVDGLIHLAPLNCAPEIMAHNALLALQRDQGVPLLALSFDEHTARAGLLTRLEAFVDLLARRPDRKPSGHAWQGWANLPSLGARREKK